MSLIKCPECNKEISDKATSCPMCGYPIGKENNKLLTKTASTIGMNICPKCGNFIIAKQKCPDCGTNMIDCNCSEEKWTNMLLDGTLNKWEELMRNKYVLSSDKFDKNLYGNRIKNEQMEEIYYNQLIENTSPIIHCPTCNSTKVKKISGTAKVAGAALFGLLSKTARSQFKCENCGYKW